MDTLQAIAIGFMNFAFAGVGGGWTRIAHINISEGDDCPSGWYKDSYSDVSFCRTISQFGCCSSTNFSNKVCGRARKYQKGYYSGQKINAYCVDYYVQYQCRR